MSKHVLFSIGRNVSEVTVGIDMLCGSWDEDKKTLQERDERYHQDQKAMAERIRERIKMASRQAEMDK